MWPESATAYFLWYFDEGSARLCSEPLSQLLTYCLDVPEFDGPFWAVPG